MILAVIHIWDLPRSTAMNASMGGKRKYNLIQNTDGTVSLEDVTNYDQVGSSFGAGQINQTNKAVNDSADAGKIIDDLTTIKATTQKGYIAGALALKAVNNDLKIIETGSVTINVSSGEAYIPYTGEGTKFFVTLRTRIIGSSYLFLANVTKRENDINVLIGGISSSGVNLQANGTIKVDYMVCK